MKGDPADFYRDVGEAVGHVKPTGEWSCTCGVEGQESDELRAGLALYFHRRSGHKPASEVQVDYPGSAP